MIPCAVLMRTVHRDVSVSPPAPPLLLRVLRRGPAAADLPLRRPCGAGPRLPAAVSLLLLLSLRSSRVSALTGAAQLAGGVEAAHAGQADHRLGHGEDSRQRRERADL